MNQVMEAEREIHVEGFSKNTDEKSLSNFFAAGFGKVESVTILKDVGNQAVIRFQKSVSVVTASQASNKLFLNGSKLTITARRQSTTDKASAKQSPQNAKRVNTNNERSTTTADVIVELSLVGDFDNQLHMLCQRVLLNQREHSNLMSVAAVLEAVIQDTFPGAQVLCFGSAVSGLAFKGSDLDCFVLLPEHIKRQVCYRRTPEVAQRFLVNRTKKILYSHLDKFGNIVSIPSARIPIVKFVHKPTKYNCDVSFKNLFGISNTFLIKFLLNTDSRLLPLCTFLKYWAKSHEIIGNGRMTSYSFIMLIIFYLQQLTDPLIPSLCSLQNDRSFDIWEEGWNCGFDLSFQTYPQTPNKMSLSTLVVGFFHYYSEFNFVTHVVCPLTGNSVEKYKFLEGQLLPPEMGRYNLNLNNNTTENFPTNKPMCVQDPIVLSTNTTRGVSLRLVQLFQLHCDLAIENISAALDNSTTDKLISTLLNQKVVAEDSNCKKKLAIKIPDAVLNKFGGKIDGTRVVELINNMSDIVVNIFKHVLQCKSQGNVNTPDSLRNNLSVNMCYQCDVLYNVWDSRQDSNTSEKNKESFWSHEASITDKIIEELVKDHKSPEDILFHFSMSLKTKINGKELILIMKSKNCQTALFDAFVNFFYKTMISAMDYHLELKE